MRPLEVLTLRYFSIGISLRVHCVQTEYESTPAMVHWEPHQVNKAIYSQVNELVVDVSGMKKTGSDFPARSMKSSDFSWLANG